MDKREVEQILAEALPKMRAALALDDWEIVRRVEPLDSDAMAACTVEPDRLRAVIEFDPGAHDDREDLLDSLLHELCHIMHGTFDIFEKQVNAVVQDDAVRGALAVTARMGAEGTVARLVRLITVGLGLSPEDLLRWDSGAKGVREAVETEEIRAEGSDD